ncbi:sulfite exporter TauE/SafE family protein 3-like [Mercurialis annua]|uniref:sulfite exporter TauE/SafE family protein 3-like n=1 Tax=Mercurialis annua TaxID=3986 RepID=UPI00215EF7F6|nr:sulfite exporter TauE/SafE family protein 3-like [Mercurialis annua]
MSKIMSTRWGMIFFGAILSSFVVAALLLLILLAEPRLKQECWEYKRPEDVELQHVMRATNFFYRRGQMGYKHVWPQLRFGWKVVVGSIIGFFGAACGSVGGVGGGGIFVPMLTLVIGFDAKSSTALSKCMITGAAAATVYYNLKLRHPTLELPIIDYDLALLFQPMLVLGISLGVALNVIFADWTITILLIILFIVTSTKAFLKGVETWKKETSLKKEAAGRLEYEENTIEEVEENLAVGGSNAAAQGQQIEFKREEVSIMENVCWKELGILIAVWLIILALQIGKNYSATCSAVYWVLNISQIPVAVSVTGYEAISLYKGRRRIASRGEASTDWRIHQLVSYCAIGVLAGIVGGMLGLGGGFILGPLFLEMGVPPQVSSATATFVMTFSASMSVVEYYLLKRFPVPYALYLFAVAIVAAFVGQYVVRKLISILGRASLIIFILAFTIFVSAISLGGVGIARAVRKMERKEYMGFENLCSYEA